jgi:glycosyltransferase involved in cell wall biosynthesis
MVFIIATKDRPRELRRLLQSIERQSVMPEQIIVVDSGTVRAEEIIREFPKLPFSYIYSLPPSASRQRNEGLAAISGSAEYIGFIDDDAVFEKNSFQEMNQFWSKALPLVGGASFNLVNHPPLMVASLKTHAFVERLGFYSSRRGAVLPSGFQTMIGTVDKDTWVDWLPSGAVLWRKTILDQYRFDEWYKGYSYLEDLDFSYTVGRSHQLFVVAGARYYHIPGSSGRGGDYEFGKKEVKHRLYFVRKNPELSEGKCRQALVLRLLISLLMFVRTGSPAFLKRAMGNFIGLIQSAR